MAGVLEGGTFITAIVVTISTKTGAVRMASAGHPSGVLVSDRGARTCAVRAALPLGLSDDATIEDSSMMLERGQGLYLYTDGISEPRTNTGISPPPADLHQLLREWSATPESDLGGSLAACWGPGWQRDDALAIGVRRVA